MKQNDPYGARKPHKPEHDPWMVDPTDRDYLEPADRWCRRCGKPDDSPIHSAIARGLDPMAGRENYDPARGA